MTDVLKELQALLALLSILNLLGLWVLGAYTWQANRKRVTNERITTLQESVNMSMATLKTGQDRQAERLTQVERDLQHAPTHDDLKRLHSRIDDVAGAVRGLDGKFEGANHTLQLIHAYLLNGGKQ